MERELQRRRDEEMDKEREQEKERQEQIEKERWKKYEEECGTDFWDSGVKKKAVQAENFFLDDNIGKRHGEQQDEDEKPEEDKEADVGEEKDEDDGKTAE